MKKNYIQILFAILFLTGLQFNTALAGDKIKIHLHQPPPNKLGVSDLWKLDITNTTNANITIYLEGTATEEKEGQIVSGKSKTFSVKPGKTTYGYNDFKSGDVSWKNNKYQEAIVRTGNVPTGNYTICVTALFEDGTIADQESCIEQKIEIKSETQITLVSPSDAEELDPDSTGNINFIWSGGTGPFNLRIVELKGEESPENAIKENRPIFDKEGITSTSFQYPITASKLKQGKKYAWQVSNGDVQSEIGTFNAKTNSSHQLRTLILQQGNYQSEVEPKGCICGMGQFDCICGATSYNNYNNVNEIKLNTGEIYVLIASHSISGNILQVNFADKLNIELKSNDIKQKEEVNVGQDLCKELGYSNITILPGNYTIKDNKSIEFNVRLNSFKPNNDINLISPRDNEQIKDLKKIHFQWDSAKKSKEGYTLSIFEIDEKQYNEIIKNKDSKLKIEKPLFVKTGIMQNHFDFENSSINLQVNHHYGWMVKYGPWNWGAELVTLLPNWYYQLEVLPRQLDVVVWGDNNNNGLLDINDSEDEIVVNNNNDFVLRWQFPVLYSDVDLTGMQFSIKIIKKPYYPIADPWVDGNGVTHYPGPNPTCSQELATRTGINLLQPAVFYNPGQTLYGVTITNGSVYPDFLESSTRYLCQITLNGMISPCFEFYYQ